MVLCIWKRIILLFLYFLHLVVVSYLPSFKPFLVLLCLSYAVAFVDVSFTRRMSFLFFFFFLLFSFYSLICHCCCLLLLLLAVGLDCSFLILPFFFFSFLNKKQYLSYSLRPSFFSFLFSLLFEIPDTANNI